MRGINRVGLTLDQVATPALYVDLDVLDRNICLMAELAHKAGVSVDVLVDLCPGGTRTGVDPGHSALALALGIAGTPGLHFAGLQAYNGADQHVRDASERQSIVSKYIDDITRTCDLLVQRGLVCKIISGSGTGTVGLEAGVGIFTELQPGSYIFMDDHYGRNIASRTDITFGQDLFVNACVISRVRPKYAMIDAGTKSISVDTGMPALADHPGWSVHLTGNEHGVVFWPDGHDGLRLGDKVRLIPGHFDPTVNLYDDILAIRDGRVVEIWPVLARGATW